MASDCAGCGKRVAKVRLVGKVWLGHDCGCVNHSVPRSTLDPYADLTLHHVHDESGKPIRVTSVRQLREAEKRHNFSSVVLNQEQRNFDTPPSASRQHIDQHYRRKFSRGAS